MGVYAQDIQTTTISIFQKAYNVKFIVISGDAYINWTDFMANQQGNNLDINKLHLFNST